jgi:single-stranded-DNA-specific exonuclease
MSEGKHVRFTVEAGGVRARAVAFGLGALPEGAVEGRLHATFTLELNEWQGAVEPRLVLRKLLPADAEAPVLVGEPEPGTAAWHEAVLAAATVPERVLAAVGAAGGGAHPDTDAVVLRRGATLTSLAARVGTPTGGGKTVRDRRSTGLAGTIAALVYTGEPVLVVCADAIVRRRQLTGRLGGYALCSWDALAADPRLADAYTHLVALDPPLHADHEALLLAGDPDHMAHLAWGEPELRFGRDVLDRDLALRPSLVAAYRALRDGDGIDGALGQRPAAPAARVLAVLVELGLVELDDDGAVTVPPPSGPTELDRSATFRATAQRRTEGLAWLTSESATSQAA